MKKGYAAAVAAGSILCLIAVSLIAVAQTAKPQEVTAEWNQVICIIFRMLEFLAVGITVLVIMAAGLKYLTSEDQDTRHESKRMIVNAFFTLMIIVVCVQVLNYLVTGTKVQKFDLGSCDSFFPTTTTKIGPTTTNPGTVTSSSTRPTGGSTTTSTGGVPPTNECDLVTGSGDKEKHNRQACVMAEQWSMCDIITVVSRDVCCRCLTPPKCC